MASLQKAFINPRGHVECVYDGRMHFFRLQIFGSHSVPL